MIEILSESEPDTLAVTVSGKLTKDDYRALEPELKLRADRDGKFDLLVEFTDLDGFEPSIIRDNLEFTKDFADDLAHVAVVTDDSPWSKLAAMTGAPLGQLLGIDVDRFDDRVEAWKWLRSDSGR